MLRAKHYTKMLAVYLSARGSHGTVKVLWAYFLVSLIDEFHLSRRRISFSGAQFAFPDAANLRHLLEEVFFQRDYLVAPPVAAKPLIVDAGANIGVATLYFKRLFPDARILCIEPHPATAGYLRSNIGSAQLDGIVVVEKALTTGGGPALMVGEDVSAMVTSADAPDHAIEVPSTRLKALVDTDEQIDILKLDVEGSELEVLRDIKGDLDRIDQIIVEVHLFGSRPNPLPEILQILADSGHDYDIVRWVRRPGSSPTVCVIRSWRKDAGLRRS